jgi:aminoglycoside phosphotransferase (APT) family kinase protein
VRTALSAEVEEALVAAGYRPGLVIGAGMEGVVVDLGDDLVVKTWHTRGRHDLDRLRSFYAAVASSGLPVPTPRIVAVLEVGDQHATIERRLSGRPLRDEMGDRAYFVGDDDVRSVVQILGALRAAEPAEAMSSLPVLEGEPAFDFTGRFGTSLAALVERRTERFHASLSGAVPDLDRLVDAVGSHLRAAEPARPALIHGDLIPANILVDGHGAPSAILDFGFFSTVGDPRFDAAVAASIHDMYGTRARVNEAILDDAVVAEFGYDKRVLRVYRAAYALTTSNCFSPSGSDGHFAWCAAMLLRSEIREALDL